jgi:hypothetical protein
MSFEHNNEQRETAERFPRHRLAEALNSLTNAAIEAEKANSGDQSGEWGAFTEAAANTRESLNDLTSNDTLDGSPDS